MKRLGNIWNDVLDIDNGIYCVVKGTKFKRNKRSVQKLLSDTAYNQIDYEKARAYVTELVEKLSMHTWKHKPPKHRQQFCRNRASSKGKMRNLYIPQLDDHIIAHMVMFACEKAFTRGMHPHCCGSVPGRGINHILKNVSNWMQHDKQCRYFVKLDIKHFFESIDADKLLDVLSKHIKDKDAMWVFEQIIRSAPVACPIGYYTSPWFANLLLQDFDWFIEQQLYTERRGKHVKWVKHYLRYVDDMLLIGTSRKNLKMAVMSIEEYLVINYGLEIKQSWEIKQIGRHKVVDGKYKLVPNTYWCDIGGYKFCRDATIMRDGIFLATRRLARLMYRQGYYKEHQCKSIVSRKAWADHCDSGNFEENDIEPYVSITIARRKIGYVDKIRKRRSRSTDGSGNFKQRSDYQKKLPSCA